MLIRKILAALCLLIASSANALDVQLLDASDFIFRNDRCHVTDTCDLERVVFRVRDYRILPDHALDVDIYGTAFLAGMQTTSVEALRKYSIVQFIRGCMWISYRDAAGEIVTAFRVIRESHLGQRGLMVHRDWTVDTGDNLVEYHADPTTMDRHFFLQWTNPAPTGVPEEQGNLLGQEPATIPFGFITDYPGPAVLRPAGRLEAQNSSLQFRTCVYRAKDVPTSTTFGMPSEFHIQPLACYEWQHSFVYNHNSGTFESPPAPHKMCLRPFTVDEEKAINTLRVR